MSNNGALNQSSKTGNTENPIYSWNVQEDVKSDDSALPLVEPYHPSVMEGDGIELTRAYPRTDPENGLDEIAVDERQRRPSVDVTGGGPAPEKDKENLLIGYMLHGVEVGVGETLHKYAREGRADAIQLMMSKMKSRVKRCINQLDSENMAPIHYASRYNNFECVKVLVEEGSADVNVVNNERATALHYAARYRRKRNLAAAKTDLEGDDQEMITQSVSGGQRMSIAGQGQRMSIAGQGQRMSIGGQRMSIDLRGAWGVAAQNAKRILEEENRPTKDNSVILYLVSHGAQVNRQDYYGCTALHYAAMRGNEVATQHLLMVNTIDIEVNDNEEMTPLHLACCHSQPEIVKMLLDKFANLMCKEESGWLPIHMACAEGNLGVVEKLLEAAESRHDQYEVQAMLNQEDVDHNSPLHAAVENGHVKVCELMIKKNADVNAMNALGETPLHLACHCGSLPIAKLLLGYDANIDCPNIYQQTPLHKAAEHNRVDVIKYLIDKGANLEGRDVDSYTPLLLAAVHGHCDSIRTLSESGADVTVTEKNNKTALFLAAEENFPGAVQVLLESTQGTTLVDTANKDNDTPLHVACSNGFADVIRILLANKAIVDAKNEEEKTPMHLAAMNGHTNVVKLLIQHTGVGLINDEDEDSNTPLHLAAFQGHYKVVNVLLDAGADIEARNSNKWTPLDCAADKGKLKVAEILLKNDSPVDPKDKSKVTPLYLACKNGHFELVQLLLFWNADLTLRVACEDDDPKTGSNPLDAAIDNGHKPCVRAIIKSPRWEEALRNQTKTPTGRLDTPMRKLIRKMPDMAEEVFNRCTVSNNLHPEHVKYKITFNYEFLDDMYAHWDVSSEQKPGDFMTSSKSSDNASLTGRSSNVPHEIYDENDKLIPTAVPYDLNSNVLKTNHPLMIMAESKREDLLAHPLVISLLRQKWNGFGRVVYYLNLFFYVVFLTFFTIYMMDTPATFSYVNKNSSIIIRLDQEMCNQVRTYYTVVQNPAASVCKYGVMVLAAINVFKELLQLLLGGFNYFSLENLLEWAIYVLSFVTVLDVNDCQRQTGVRESWQWQTGAVAIFLSWLNLVLFLRKVPRFGIYVVMFTDVLKTFAKFSVVFFLFIVSFAFGFFILLSNQVSFSNFGRSMLKTAVMMIGEFEYTTIFDTQVPSPLNHADQVYYDGVTYALFVLSMIIMSILLMNLLVGLAVDDIKAVQDQAVLKRLAMQVELALGVESLLPHLIRRKFINRTYVLRPNKPARFKWMTGTSFTGSSLQQALNAELDDWEKLFEQQQKTTSQLMVMKTKLRNMRTQNVLMQGMIKAIMNKMDITFTEDDIQEDENEERMNALLY